MGGLIVFGYNYLTDFTHLTHLSPYPLSTWRSESIGYPFNISPKLLQSPVNILVAAVDLFYILNNTFPFVTQRRDQ